MFAREIPNPTLISSFSLFNLEMNGPDIVADGCTHFPQLFVWERRGKLKLELKLAKELRRIPHKYAMVHICVGPGFFFQTPFPTCPRSETSTSTKNDLQYLKRLGQANIEH